jgi:hypothetical protein
VRTDGPRNRPPVAFRAKRSGVIILQQRRARPPSPPMAPMGVRVSTSNMHGASKVVKAAPKPGQLVPLPLVAGKYGMPEADRRGAKTSLERHHQAAAAAGGGWLGRLKVVWTAALTLLLALALLLALKHVSDLSELRGNLDTLSAELRSLRAEADGARAETAALQRQVAAAAHDGVTRGVATMGIDLGAVGATAGSAARLAFEARFESDVAQLLGAGVDASRVRVERVAAGSVVVGFAVLPDAEGAPLQPGALAAALSPSGGAPSLQLGGADLLSFREVPSLQTLVRANNQTALREDLMAEVQQLRTELAAVAEQRRRAAEKCAPGQRPTGVAISPCAPCPSGTFSGAPPLPLSRGHHRLPRPAGWLLRGRRRTPLMLVVPDVRGGCACACDSARRRLRGVPGGHAPRPARGAVHARARGSVRPATAPRLARGLLPRRRPRVVCQLGRAGGDAAGDRLRAAAQPLAARERAAQHAHRPGGLRARARAQHHAHRVRADDQECAVERGLPRPGPQHHRVWHGAGAEPDLVRAVRDPPRQLRPQRAGDVAR